MTIAEDNINSRIESTLKNQRELNPAQRRQFLGNFKERVILFLKESDLKADTTFEQVSQNVNQLQGTKIDINGNVSHKLIRPYINLFSQNKLPFTILNDPNIEGKDNPPAIVVSKRLSPAAESDKINLNLTSDHAKNQLSTAPRPSFFKKVANFFTGK